MASLEKNSSGFTIVELLIVIVIIGILSGLVVTQILGASKKARDTERKTDLDSISVQLEAYYAKAGGYPTLADLNNEGWREKNEFTAGDNGKALHDPSQPTADLVGTIPTGRTGAYTYTPEDSGCVSPTDANGDATTSGDFCSGYTLVALLENDKDKSATTSGSGNSAQYRYTKTSANK